MSFGSSITSYGTIWYPRVWYHTMLYNSETKKKTRGKKQCTSAPCRPSSGSFIVFPRKESTHHSDRTWYNTKYWYWYRYHTIKHSLSRSTIRRPSSQHYLTMNHQQQQHQQQGQKENNQWMMLQLMLQLGRQQEQHQLEQSGMGNHNGLSANNNKINGKGFSTYKLSIIANDIEDFEPTPLPSNMDLPRVVSMPESSQAKRPSSTSPLQPPSFITFPTFTQPATPHMVPQFPNMVDDISMFPRQLPVRPTITSNNNDTSFLTERQRCLVFVKVLLKYLAKRGLNVKRVKQVVAACIQQQRQGTCERLTDLLDVQLRKCVGEIHWQNANHCFDAYCRQRGLWTANPTPIRV
eukprot:scaffold964_cov170-Amphora_coffeaeformis.AAC.3